MFEISFDSVKVMGCVIGLKDGENSVYLNPSNGNIVSYQKEDYIKIATINYDKKTKTVKIESETELFSDDIKDDFDFKKYHNCRNLGNGRMIANGPYYGNSALMGSTEFLEGLPISFNYNSFIMSSISIASYNWAGGRMCFNTTLTRANVHNPPFTGHSPGCSIPSSFSVPQISLAIPMTLFYGNWLAAMKWINGMTSIVDFFYTHRQYTNVEINKNDLFRLKIKDSEIKINPIALDKVSASTSPDWAASMSMLNILK